MQKPYWIPDKAKVDDFPPLEQALQYPDGLIAIGGDLSEERIIMAYKLGIFPWYNDNEPILWWSPNQRMVLFPEQLKVARSLRKIMRKNKFTLTLDQSFKEVITACAGFRHNQNGTWITDDMQAAYYHLHVRGVAHSVEAWYEDNLVGGLYGIALGKVFFGESMFTRVSDASKVAFVNFVWQLQNWGYELIDCQITSDHLRHFGAVEIPRSKYRKLLDKLCKQDRNIGRWKFE
ncbi:leucyl/phenylalanyl-tRNA--protein transferase [Thiotrichales bacterium HSG1]|nr:leucyl/phenylalanyl-tRNA--protein transferase [Thiotrichales bacterium HSG1]